MTYFNAPPLRWLEQDAAYLATAEAPGADPGSIAIRQRGGVLEIEVRRGRQGSYHHEIALPADADPQRVFVSILGDCLHVCLPKTVPTPASRGAQRAA